MALTHADYRFSVTIHTDDRAVVTRDVPDYATVVGVPARIVRVADPEHFAGANVA